MDCYSEELQKDPKNLIKKVCGSLYRPSANQNVKDLVLCLDKQTFCGQCCRGFLGVILFEEREACMNRCESTVGSSGTIDMNVLTDNGITTNEFLYGTQAQEAKEAKERAMGNNK